MRAIIESLGALLRALFGSQGRFINNLRADSTETYLEEEKQASDVRRAA